MIRCATKQRLKHLNYVRFVSFFTQVYVELKGFGFVQDCFVELLTFYLLGLCAFVFCFSSVYFGIAGDVLPHFSNFIVVKY